MKEYDLIVIGAGSGGVRAARISANHGAKVLVAEGLNYGGTCVNRGCVPKKLFTYAAQYNSDLNNARTYGWELPDHIPFNWQTLIKNKDKEIDRLNDIYKSIVNNLEYENINEAIIKEKQLKSGKRTRKEKLVVLNNSSWEDLAKDWVFHF